MNSALGLARPSPFIPQDPRGARRPAKPPLCICRSSPRHSGNPPLPASQAPLLRLRDAQPQAAGAPLRTTKDSGWSDWAGRRRPFRLRGIPPILPGGLSGFVTKNSGPGFPWMFCFKFPTWPSTVCVYPRSAPEKTQPGRGEISSTSPALLQLSPPRPPQLTLPSLQLNVSLPLVSKQFKKYAIQKAPPISPIFSSTGQSGPSVSLLPSSSDLPSITSPTTPHLSGHSFADGLLEALSLASSSSLADLTHFCGLSYCSPALPSLGW